MVFSLKLFRSPVHANSLMIASFSFSLWASNSISIKIKFVRIDVKMSTCRQ